MRLGNSQGGHLRASQKDVLWPLGKEVHGPLMSTFIAHVKTCGIVGGPVGKQITNQTYQDHSTLSEMVPVVLTSIKCSHRVLKFLPGKRANLKPETSNAGILCAKCFKGFSRRIF